MRTLTAKGLVGDDTHLYTTTGPIKILAKVKTRAKITCTESDYYKVKLSQTNVTVLNGR